MVSGENQIEFGTNLDLEPKLSQHANVATNGIIKCELYNINILLYILLYPKARFKLNYTKSWSEKKLEKTLKNVRKKRSQER